MGLDFTVIPHLFRLNQSYIFLCFKYNPHIPHSMSPSLVNDARSIEPAHF